MIFPQITSTLPIDPSALERAISALESAISALERDIKALEISSGHWEPWAWVFSFMVVVGVFMELWIVRHDWRDDMEVWAIWEFLGITRLPARPSRVKLRVEIASVLLIGLGVAGELVVGIEIASINSQLRGKSAELRSKNAELRSDSDQLVALLGKEAAQLGKDAEKEHLERVKIEASVAWRTISKDDQKAIGDRLRRFPETRVLSQYEANDVEASNFVVDIDSALVAAQWHVNNPLQFSEMTAPNSPIFKPMSGPIVATGVRLNSSKKGWKAAVALTKELHDLGFDATLMPQTSDENESLLLVSVEHRPLGPQGKFKLQAEQEAKTKKKQSSNP